MDDDAVNYKSRCDEVLLPRAKSEAGMVFDGGMSDEEVMQVLQDLINAS
ncbi:MAG: hypothetical protein [Caudoviricetes sp.]|nr:MAG: hypothetical protein [Caudoviricetes sp.]